MLEVLEGPVKASGTCRRALGREKVEGRGWVDRENKRALVNESISYIQIGVVSFLVVILLEERGKKMDQDESTYILGERT